MPELPEVETVKRTLEKLVIGKTVVDVKVFWPKIIKHPDDVEQFKIHLVGQQVKGIDRRGKFLKLIFDDVVLVSHLRMEGRYGLFKRDEPMNKHVHVSFIFSDGTELRYQDVRKFGTMHLFEKGTEDEQVPLLKLGVEPFSTLFTPEYLQNIFSKTGRKVKVVLLDQENVVGLGNIYVDETLFKSKIHPERLASSLTPEEIVRLHKQIGETLQEAIDQGGSSIKSYVNGQGEMGMFQQMLFVYGRKGEPCKTCETPLQKSVVGGRGTHFCPNCQISSN